MARWWGLSIVAWLATHTVQFASSKGKEETLSDWTSPAGLGVHVEVEQSDNTGRHRCASPTPSSGNLFLRLNVNKQQATELRRVACYSPSLQPARKSRSCPARSTILRGRSRSTPHPHPQAPYC